MRTSLTAAYKKQLLSPESSEVGVSLLDIEHVSFGKIYRVCDNNEDITSNGNVYTAWAFDIAFCDEVNGEVPSHNVVLDNTDPTMFQAIRSADVRQRVKVTHRFVVASDPNTNQLKRPIVYQIADVEVDENAIVGSLVLAVIANEQVPRYTYDDYHFPGL